MKISPKTRTLILWTERGAARHAKMLETDQAWEVFEKLEDSYFNQYEKERAMGKMNIDFHWRSVTIKPPSSEVMRRASW